MIRIGNGHRLIVAALLCSTIAFAAAPVRQWQSGKLLDTEQQEVPSGSTTTYNSDGKSGTAHTSKDTDKYQIFTIQAADKTYTVRQRLYFPWSKSANITVGEQVKFTVQGNKFVILDDDQKEQKASVVKTSLNPTN